jgi:UDPglucose 6-dehydrogenase
VDAGILEAVERVNDTQKRVLVDGVDRRLGRKLSGRRIAVWGLSFKPETDDMREAASIEIIKGLLERGAEVSVHDPVAMDVARGFFGDRVTYAAHNYDALEDADALVIVTEWKPYRNPDFARMKATMRQPIVFDGRNLFDPKQMMKLGFEYFGIGRPAPDGVAPPR